MEYGEILKTFGPQAIPWLALAYVGRWLMERMDRDLEARVKMAVALEGLAAVIKERVGVKP